MSDLADKVLIWLDADIDAQNADTQQKADQLRQVNHELYFFTSPDPCVDFITDLDAHHVFLIISEPLARQLIDCLHPIPYLHQIYITNTQPNPQPKPWMDSYSKIKGPYSDVSLFSKELVVAMTLCNQDSISFSFVSSLEHASGVDRNQLEPTFMYTQMFKDALLKMEHDQQSRRDFISFCRERLTVNPTIERHLEEFERDYSADKAIWWYTRETFIYSMLNQALRLLKADVILMMGFFIVDLHRQIEQLHNQQLPQYGDQPFVVYRRQRLSKADFIKLRENKGGLISFNCFLSTSKKERLLEHFQDIGHTIDIHSILFHITVDPKLRSAAFADLSHHSAFPEEEEILFTMHTVFRIKDISEQSATYRLIQLSLTTTEQHDGTMGTLAESILPSSHRVDSRIHLANLLTSIHQTDMIKKLYPEPLSASQDFPTQIEAHYYRALNDHANGETDSALYHLLQSRALAQKHLSETHPLVPTIYNLHALVLLARGEHKQALSFHQQAIDIEKKSLPPNHPQLATSYSNMGSVYNNMGEHKQALSFYQQAIDIRQKSLPPNHPDLATSYNKMGSVYHHMGEHKHALSFFEQAIDIQKKSLPPNHPHLATYYSNMGSMHLNMGEHEQALSLYQQAIDMKKKSLPPNHPDLAILYNNIGKTKLKMGLRRESLAFLREAKAIWGCTLPSTHPHITAVSRWIEIIEGSLLYS